MPINYSCENLVCPILIKGECNYAQQVVGQANTTKNPLITHQFSKNQLGKVIENFTHKGKDIYCRPEEDLALQLALEYAKNIWSQMPESN